MFLQHAQEAVQVLNEDCRDQFEATAFPQIQYEEALRLFEAAQDEAAERAAELEAEAPEEGEEVGEDAGQEEGMKGVETAEEAEVGATAQPRL